MSFWDIEEKSPEFNFDIEKQKFIENMDYLFSMSVEEQTLYKKWIEWNSDITKTYPMKFRMGVYYDQIWRPADIMNVEQTVKEIEDLDPYVEIVEESADATKWVEIRKLIHTMEFNANPGRNVKCYVKDRKTGKILGQICLGSDVTALKVRDDYIGWTRDNRFKDGKLNNTTIATTIVATQPLGYNFLGGKLIAALSTSPTIREYWKEKYENELIAVGTTSLYGIHSQYNGIPHFKTLGVTAGKIAIKPDDSAYDPWHQWLKENDKEWYDTEIKEERIRNGENMYGKDSGRSGPVSGIKQKILGRIFKHLGIKTSEYHHGFQRGFYFAQMYDNGNEFLCNKIGKDELVMKQKFIDGDEYTVNWWKKKAISRYRKLMEENRIKDETLFYIDIIGMSWEQAKERYLKDVGR